MTRCMLIPFLLGIPALTAFGQEKVLFEEKFEGALDKEWSWVREDPKAWKLDKGSLVCRVLPGYLHAKSNNSRNVLLRALPKSDKPLAVEVYLEGEPKVQFEHAGVVWYQDDDNYVSLFQEVLNKKVELQMVTEREAKPTFRTDPYKEKEVRMRLVIDGGKIRTEFKPAGEAAWKLVGASEMPTKTPAKVGLMCGGAPKEAERYVKFRGFRIVEIGK